MTKRPHKTRAATASRQTTQQQPSQLWYKRLWVVASAAGAAALAIGLNGPTILQNLRKVPTEILATSDQYLSWLKDDEKWTGNWSNFPEGIVNTGDMKLSSGVDLRISIVSKSGDISGEISNSAICKNVSNFDFLMIRGKVNGNSAKVTVWDIIGGNTATFADLDLVRKDDVITVNPVNGGSDWFPYGARLGKHQESDKEFLTRFCNRTPSPSAAQKK